MLVKGVIEQLCKIAEMDREIGKVTKSAGIDWDVVDNYVLTHFETAQSKEIGNSRHLLTDEEYEPETGKK